MNRYYSNNLFFVWLRDKLGINKPAALPWGQWQLWEDDLKARRPVAYFLTETLPEWLEKPAEWIVDPIDSAIYYVRRRWIHRSHLINTGLPPGKYYGVDTLYLHGMFNQLVKFVEEEKAWMCIRWESKEDREKYKVPFWVDNWYLRWFPWNNPQAGIDHLKWEMGLEYDESQNQINSALETYTLYLWWKEIRSKRDIEQDAWTESGMKNFYDIMDKKYGEGKWNILSGNSKLTRAERQEYDRISKMQQKIEEDWHQEDEDMMIRLVRLRRSLWT